MKFVIKLEFGIFQEKFIVNFHFETMELSCLFSI